MDLATSLLMHSVHANGSLVRLDMVRKKVCVVTGRREHVCTWFQTSWMVEHNGGAITVC